jgi:hypothetical protein
MLDISLNLCPYLCKIYPMLPSKTMPEGKKKFSVLHSTLHSGIGSFKISLEERRVPKKT